jgi:hypothetical protein
VVIKYVLVLDLGARVPGLCVYQWYSVVVRGTRGTHQWYPSEVIKYVLDLGARVPGLGVVHNGRYEDVCDVGDLVVVLASAELGS